MCASVCPSIHLFGHTFVYLYNCMSAGTYVHLSVHPYVCHYICKSIVTFVHYIHTYLSALVISNILSVWYLGILCSCSNNTGKPFGYSECQNDVLFIFPPGVPSVPLWEVISPKVYIVEVFLGLCSHVFKLE